MWQECIIDANMDPPIDSLSSSTPAADHDKQEPPCDAKETDPVSIPCSQQHLLDVTSPSPQSSPSGSSRKVPGPPPPSPVFLRQGRRSSASSTSSQPVAGIHSQSSAIASSSPGAAPSTGTTSHLIPDVAATSSLHTTSLPPAATADDVDDDDERTVTPVDREKEANDQEEDQQSSHYYAHLLKATCKSLNDQQKDQPSSSSSLQSLATAAASTIQPDIVSSTIHDKSTDPQSGPSTVFPTPVPGSSSEQKSPEADKGIYRLKWIDCLQSSDHQPSDPKEKESNANKIAIITQNENGPCPLIAIMNVLLLKGDLRLPKILDVITADQLMEFLGDCILSNMPSNLSNGAQLNYEQNMMDAIAILPKLQTGLDVNVRFTSVTDFEFTPELIVFDLLRIPLYHGWLVDPVSDPDAAAAIGSCSYNQLVDKIINCKSSDKSSLVTEGNYDYFANLF